MSSIVISGDSSGAITLAAPSVAGTNTATLPAATGTVMVSGNMPAFSAYQSSVQSISNATATKVQLQTKTFDTATAFDNTTNYRFQPTVAGYYQINGSANFGIVSGTSLVYIYKNGSVYKQGVYSNSSSIGSQSFVADVIYLNGSTDYVELYVYQNSGSSANTTAGIQLTYFSGSMVRTA